MNRTEWLLIGIFVFLWWMMRTLAGQSPVSFGDITNKPVFNAVNGSDPEEIAAIVKEVTKPPLPTYDQARLLRRDLGPPDALTEWVTVLHMEFAREGHAGMYLWERVP